MKTVKTGDKCKQLEGTFEYECIDGYTVRTIGVTQKYLESVGAEERELIKANIGGLMIVEPLWYEKRCGVKYVEIEV